MNKRTFQEISSFLVFKSLIALALFHFTLSAPVKTISYDAFLRNITGENCSFPKGIVLPFSESSTTLQFFSEPLKICNAPDSITRSLEAIRLCNEIYDALRNITCQSDKSVQLPEIKIEFSEHVCNDINFLKLKYTLPEKGLMLHLTDKFVCEMMCEGDFLPACQVLLWTFQLQKRIEGIPQVQSIQNTPEQENANAGNGDLSSVTKSIVKPDQEDSVLVKEQQSLPNQEAAAIENPDYNKKMDGAQQIVNDDTDKNELDQTLNVGKDEQNNNENEIPEEQPSMDGKKGNQVISKQDQTVKTDKQNQSHQSGNEAGNDAKEEAVEIKINQPTPLDKNLPGEENKINADELPTKNTVSSDSEKTIFNNKPVVSITEQAKNISSNKTEVTKNFVEPQNNLPPEAPKENSVHVKPVETASTIPVKPTISKQNDERTKLQDKVSSPSTPSKMLPPGTNEAKVSIKPESTSSKVNEIADTKVVPTIGKEDTVSVTTVADLEKMEEGNGVPDFADREPDPYNDSESDGEYSKLDYGDDGVFDSSKNRKPEEPEIGKISKPALAENESPKYDFPQRNSYGRTDPLGFPEQEDSHFFFYFLSLVLFLMGGYLLFHNKQKIIALIVEGRHERRRRSHGVGYKKLETK